MHRDFTLCMTVLCYNTPGLLYTYLAVADMLLGKKGNLVTIEKATCECAAE